MQKIKVGLKAREGVVCRPDNNRYNHRDVGMQYGNIVCMQMGQKMFGLVGPHQCHVCLVALRQHGLIVHAYYASCSGLIYPICIFMACNTLHFVSILALALNIMKIFNAVEPPMSEPTLTSHCTIQMQFLFLLHVQRFSIMHTK